MGEWDGESLHLQLISERMGKRVEGDRRIAEIKTLCMDDGWKLQNNEIVYVGSRRWPYRVMRNGWGLYETEVRVARLHEDVREHASGEWVSTADCARLEVGDCLDAMGNIQ